MPHPRSQKFSPVFSSLIFILFSFISVYIYILIYMYISLGHKDILVFYSISFIVLSYTERSLMHLEFTFVYGLRQRCDLISVQVSQSFQSHLDNYFSLLLKWNTIIYQAFRHTRVYFWVLHLVPLTSLTFTITVLNTVVF